MIAWRVRCWCWLALVVLFGACADDGGRGAVVGLQDAGADAEDGGQDPRDAQDPDVGDGALDVPDVPDAPPGAPGAVCASDEGCQEGLACVFDLGVCGQSEGKCRERPERCAEVVEPVCGCDGQTYDNGCLAALEGISLEREGACEDPPPMCRLNADCPEGRFCECVGDACGEGGRCEPVPEACDDALAPVCGCDGQTYANDCQRRRAGVCLGPQGACGSVERCESIAECRGARFCEFVPGTCDAVGRQGFCEDQPESCPPLDEPVCGCDGGTYANDCERRRAGVPLDHGGRCVAPRPCDFNAECDPGDFCACSALSCGAGICEPRAAECPDVGPGAEVCGCDSQTWPSDCHRRAAGVCLLHAGRCLDAVPDQCEDNGACTAGEFCDFGGSQCGGVGRCRPRPGGCGQEFEPVCGCDGLSYDNACLAQRIGVAVAAQGQCREPRVRCATSDECGQGQFCECSGDQCGDGGCVELPVACPVNLDPVCGCDGVTYPNDCLRQAEAVCLLSRGACPEPMELCRSVADCRGADPVCIFERGGCHEAGVGVCQERPAACPDDGAPVCGCDGVTYASDCDAAAVGISVATEGACPDDDPRVRCGSDADCGDREFCQCALGVCGAGGFCEPLPELCPDGGDPVCGCDGRTFENDCFRQLGRTCLQHLGPCGSPPPQGCRDNQECPPEQMCEFELNTCQRPDRRGECVPRPEVCAPDPNGPVCGCDGVSYETNCHRQQQGVPLAYRGECDAPLQRCFGPGECGEGRFCDCQGTCGFIGICKNQPTSCPPDDAPVCGCDGVTYENDCERRRAGACQMDDVACERSLVCIPIQQIDCPMGFVCDAPPDQCGDIEAVGVCIDVFACDDQVMDPVCACDGRTFDNDCLRLRAGERKLRGGVCDPQELACVSDAQCAQGTFCDLEAGTCNSDGMGTCEEVPPTCGDEFEPVCGCDGVSYRNQCQRQRARVPADHPGQCR